MAEFKIDTNGVQYFEHEGIKIGIGGNGEITSDTIPLEGLMQAVEEIQQAQAAQAQGRAFPIESIRIMRVWSSEKGFDPIDRGQMTTNENHGGRIEVETFMRGDGSVDGFVNGSHIRPYKSGGDSYSGWYHYWDLGIRENAYFEFRAHPWNNILEQWSVGLSIL
ncbi:hypothetical protein CCZ01_08315 [Helicobacter monodelphidis]|uniref:DUF4879 domain-containing protein n=1 Tax=Helicobacter sp. 15-1451 TaxID=2004995 RepID=UPI000DCCBCF9|nr:DUF4879 domain-containing protein [Helicobacter sp. 15-1451]RAX56852.1 hypothetical protein CCZ01_08315 [Helicobacter sp. 15-1451]